MLHHLPAGQLKGASSNCYRHFGAPPQGAYSGSAPPSTYGSESLSTVGGGEYAAVEPGAGAAPSRPTRPLTVTCCSRTTARRRPGSAIFWKTYPQDALAPNALYWLGESHYVQRNYADAAEAFDLVLSAYGTSSIRTRRAAQARHGAGSARQAAGCMQRRCAASAQSIRARLYSFKAKADSERQRIGCPCPLRARPAAASR